MKELTEEVIEIFSDKELRLDRVLRELASCFGADASIHEIATELEIYKTPKKEVNGITFIAGYKGPNILEKGHHSSFLADIKQSGSDLKLMFVVGDKYIFQTIPKWRAEDVVNYTKKLNKPYRVDVVYDTIVNTGSVHATVLNSVEM